MIRCINFTKELIPEAEKILEHNYLEERKAIPILPKEPELPYLREFAENRLGYAIVGDRRLFGFLCIGIPWQDPFDTKSFLSAFSPLHAHGAITEHRGRIYQDLIETAAEKWLEFGVKKIGIALYAHDETSKQGLFEYGFGMCCKDAIARIDDLAKMDLPVIADPGFRFFELMHSDFPKVRDLRSELNRHLQQSPCFMRSSEEEYHRWLERVEKSDQRTFAVEDKTGIVAYLDIAEEGENFVTYHPAMMSIKGAYCKPEYRGSLLYDRLLKFVAEKLSAEGYYYLGVDYESYNPCANRYWPKHFTAYTNSVKRIIR